MAYLERDSDNPSIVWVKPNRNALPWFCIDPVRCLVRIQGRGHRETLDMDEIKRKALDLVRGIDKDGQAVV